MTEIATGVRLSIYLSQTQHAAPVAKSVPTNDPLDSDRVSRLESRLELRLESKLAAKVILPLKSHESGKAADNHGSPSMFCVLVAYSNPAAIFENYVTD